MKKVLYIDDDQQAHITFKINLEEIFGDEVEVLTYLPERRLADMTSKILSEERIVSLVTDERMKQRGTAEYNGIELARELRKYNSKMPIYILTSWPNDTDIKAEEYQVDEVIDKGVITDREKIRLYSARIRRKINVYKDIMSARAKRFEKLLIKSISQNLSEEEKKEYKDLKLLRSREVLAEEALPSQELKTKLDEQESKLNELKRKLKNI